MCKLQQHHCPGWGRSPMYCLHQQLQSLKISLGLHCQGRLLSFDSPSDKDPMKWRDSNAGVSHDIGSIVWTTSQHNLMRTI
jgi:hypothetical protein